MILFALLYFLAGFFSALIFHAESLRITRLSGFKIDVEDQKFCFSVCTALGFFAVVSVAVAIIEFRTRPKSDDGDDWRRRKRHDDPLGLPPSGDDGEGPDQDKKKEPPICFCPKREEVDSVQAEPHPRKGDFLLHLLFILFCFIILLGLQ